MKCSTNQNLRDVSPQIHVSAAMRQNPLVVLHFHHPLSCPLIPINDRLIRGKGHSGLEIETVQYRGEAEWDRVRSCEQDRKEPLQNFPEPTVNVKAASSSQSLILKIGTYVNFLKIIKGYWDRHWNRDLFLLCEAEFWWSILHPAQFYLFIGGTTKIFWVTTKYFRSLLADLSVCANWSLGIWPWNTYFKIDTWHVCP